MALSEDRGASGSHDFGFRSQLMVYISLKAKILKTLLAPSLAGMNNKKTTEKDRRM